jgi:hypothetical protein
MKKSIFTTCYSIVASTLLLASCSKIPAEAYGQRGSPESLLDVSSEIVTVELLSQASVEEIADWVESDQPTRAEIYCVEGDMLCDEAEQVFSVFGVEYEWIPSQVSEANLIYERVIAHDCENRFIDNRINPYNLNHPTFGCSVASNTVKMVSDRRQFVSPALLDFYDGRQAVKNVNSYRAFSASEYFDDDLGIDAIKFQGSN